MDMFLSLPSQNWIEATEKNIRILYSIKQSRNELVMEQNNEDLIQDTKQVESDYHTRIKMLNIFLEKYRWKYGL